MNTVNDKVRATLLASGLSLLGNGTALAGPQAQAAAAALKNWWENEYLNTSPAPETPLWTAVQLTRAKPDECYDGNPNANPYLPATNPPALDLTPLDPDTGAPLDGHTYSDTCSEGVPKFNEAYVWGEVRAGNDTWFGIMTNVGCVILGGTKIIVPTSPDPIPPGLGYRLINQVCEYNQSWNAANMPDGYEYLADWRRPHIRVWDNANKALIEPAIPAGVPADRLANTLGIRFAGKFGNRIVLGGPTIEGSVGKRGINLFVFDASNRSFLGSCNLSQYNDIRRGVTVQKNGVDNQFYFTVRTAPSIAGSGGGKGAVVRWSPNQLNLCKFTEVGRLDNMGSEIVQFGNRLVVGTWINFAPDTTSSIPTFQLPPTTGLYVSPTIPGAGFAASHKNSWKKVWNISTNWEPDTVAGLADLIGAMAVYKGWLYFGLMMQPGTVDQIGQILHSRGYLNLDADNDGTLDQDDVIALRRGASRPPALFRGQNFGLFTQKVEVLYGNRYVPVYDQQSRTYTAPPAGGDAAHSNNMNAASKWGKAGFDCLGTFYVWSALSMGDTLFIGTAGLSSAFLFTDSLPGQGNAWADFNHAKCAEGGDLMRFDDDTSAAKAESRTGLGNRNNIFRNMQPGDTGPIVGTANNSNLSTNPPGGWELIELTKP
ncbi:MAG: hypothetical protein AB1648_14615 [Pseudomonadota bacterium]